MKIPSLCVRQSVNNISISGLRQTETLNSNREMKSGMPGYQLCIDQSINQSMHWEGRLAIELGSLGLCRNHPKEDFFICIDISNLRQLFDCYQPINLNSFNLGQSALHYLDSLSPFNISISSNSHHHKYVGQRSLNCTNVRESCDFVKLVNLPFCNFVFVGAKRTNRNVFFSQMCWLSCFL